MVCISFLAAIGVLLTLLYSGRGFLAWTAAAAVLVVMLFISGWTFVAVLIAVPAAVLGAVFGSPAMRQKHVSSKLLPLVRNILPTMGETEREALEAGTVWWDGDLFSGKPDWRKLLEFKRQPLSEREQAFLDGPVEELCAMIDDWEIYQTRAIPDEIWAFLKKHKFLGLIVPEEFGGLGFSALAQSTIVSKISSRSIPVSIVVMVPNSLGPGELISHYGTDEQKKKYLNRLACGDEIPCFALTEPEAGSDAASPRSTGIVCKGEYDGKEVLGLRLNWEKRYITLSPVATTVGLAFRALDPNGLLGNTEDLGITCALIPHDLPGVDIGNRHDPMGIPFPNGPIFGKDVFVPLDFIIGGREGIGGGWRMLMDCLAAGRSISLPALSVASMELAARTTGAYATIREQFGLPIGKFEGVVEPLSRIAGSAYIMNATRQLTCGAIDAGEKPAVLSAIAKAYLTNAMRDAANDAFDIMGGAAICRGPRNILSRGYVGIPIAITVEGANILTRSMIVYGQGAIRCHPWVQKEMEAVAINSVEQFDNALFGHINFFACTAARSFLLALTGGRVTRVPGVRRTAIHFQRLTRLSSAFALTSDVAMATLGGALKRKESITGRLADALAWLYMASAALKKFKDEGGPDEHLPLVHWACMTAEKNVQDALFGVIENLPNRWAAWALRILVFPLGRRLHGPSDRISGDCAKSIMDGAQTRLDLSQDIYVPTDPESALGRLEDTLTKVVRAQPYVNLIKDAAREGRLPEGKATIENAIAKDIINEKQAEIIKEANAARLNAIQVDVFNPADYANIKG